MPSSSLHYFLSHVRSQTDRIHLSPDHTAFLYKTGGTYLWQTKQTAGKQQLPISALDALSGNSQNLLHQSKMCHRSHRLWILFFPPLPRLLRKDGNPIRFLLPPPGFSSEIDDCNTDEIYLLLEGPLDRKLPRFVHRLSGSFRTFSIRHNIRSFPDHMLS